MLINVNQMHLDDRRKYYNRHLKKELKTGQFFLAGSETVKISFKGGREELYGSIQPPHENLRKP